MVFACFLLSCLLLDAIRKELFNSISIEDFKPQLAKRLVSLFDFVFSDILCYTSPHNLAAPLDPDLEDENELVQLIPLCVGCWLKLLAAEERAKPQAQCTLILPDWTWICC